MRTIGQRIRARRRELKLTQEEVAKKVGVSSVAVGHWEKDTNEPSGTNLHALAKVLRVTIDDLIQDSSSVRERPASYNATLSDEALEVARAFERSSPEMKAAALRLLEVLQHSDKNSKVE